MYIPAYTPVTYINTNKIYKNVYVSAYISYMCTHRCVFVYAQIDIIIQVCKFRFEVLPGVGMCGNTSD